MKKNNQIPSRIAQESSLTCIVPMYNEQGHAADFVQALYAKVQPLFAKVQIIVINDGSKDQTDTEINQVLQQDIPLRYLQFSRNFGKEAALTAGLQAAQDYDPDAVLIIDADFQHPFTTIDLMLEHWQGGIDMVYGVQVNRQQLESLVMRAGKATFYGLMNLFNANNRFDIPRNAGDFRLFDRKVLTALNTLTEKSRYMKGLFAWVGFSSVGVPFQADVRKTGTSSFSFLRLVELALNGLTSFSTWPLRLAMSVGVTISMLACLYGLWILIEWFFWEQPIKGFTTLASALMFFSGIQLLFIGLVGEYIGKIFVEVKQRPPYVLTRDTASKAPTADEVDPADE